MTTSIWLCPYCAADLKVQNLKYGCLSCDACGAHFRIGEEEQVVHETYVVPPIPDPESNDE